jgi:hypothetical protein
MIEPAAQAAMKGFLCGLGFFAIFARKLRLGIIKTNPTPKPKGD